MAQIEVYVDPDASGGGTGVDWTNAYTTMNAMVTGEVAGDNPDLDGDGNYMTVYCRANSGTKDTTECLIDGFTTSAGSHLEVISHPDHRHEGIWVTPDGTNKIYCLSVAESKCVEIQDTYVKLIGLEFEHPNGYNYSHVSIYSFVTSSSSLMVVSHNLLKCVEQDGNKRAIAGGAGKPHSIYNNIMFDYTDRGIYCQYSNASTEIYNNTVINCDEGINGDSDVQVIRNNICQDNAGADYLNVGSATMSANIDEDGTGDITSSLTFNNKAGFDCHLVAGDTAAIDAGTDLSGIFLDDIDFVTRSGDWDIGADQYVSGGTLIETSILDTVTITEDVNVRLKALNIDINDTVTVGEALD
jgi:parallel beta-helix repeat protein